MRLNKSRHVEHWDDERDIGNGIILTIWYGFSFEDNEHQGVRGFDTLGDISRAIVFRCGCTECKTNRNI